MADEEEVEESFPDEAEDPVFWWRFERLFEHGHEFPADVALQLAARKRIDTVYALKLLEQTDDPELVAEILI